MPPRILITRSLPPEAMSLAQARAAVDLHPGPHSLPRADLIARLKDKAGLVCLITDTIDAEVLSGAPELKVVANVAVGYNNIDVAAATTRGIVVTNTPEVLTETTADFTWALLMAVARRVVEGDGYVRAGKFGRWEWELLWGADVHGKTLGIFGFGRIGKAVARRARGFGMRILYHDTVRADAAAERELGATYVDKTTLLKESDFVTLHTLLSPETRNLIGAALDVYEEEPKVHPGLLSLPNVVLAPHIANASRETRLRMATLAVENCLAVLEGEV